MISCRNVLPIEKESGNGCILIDHSLRMMRLDFVKYN